MASAGVDRGEDCKELTMIKKNLDLIIVAFIILAVVMYDVTLDFLEEFLHLLFEILHNLFEWVELGVESVVDHIFHFLHIGEFVEYLFITERHGSQFVTFWFLMTIIGLCLYRLSKHLPKLYGFVKQQVLIAWIRRKTQFQLYWRPLSQLHKAAVGVVALGILFIASFLII
jgi:hypothetical protein